MGTAVECLISTSATFFQRLVPQVTAIKIKSTCVRRANDRRCEAFRELLSLGHGTNLQPEYKNKAMNSSLRSKRRMECKGRRSPSERSRTTGNGSRRSRYEASANRPPKRMWPATKQRFARMCPLLLCRVIRADCPPRRTAYSLPNRAPKGKISTRHLPRRLACDWPPGPAVID